MGFFGNHPRILYFVRLLQICLASATLVFICYDGVHRGWWDNINGPLAVGVITCLFTLVISFMTIWIQHRSNPFSGGSRTHTILRIGAEVIGFLLWIATATLMLRPKGGCSHRAQDNGFDVCYKDDKHYKNWTDQPVITWNIATAFAFVEIVSFVGSAFLVFRDERASKVPSGGVSYA